MMIVPFVAIMAMSLIIHNILHLIDGAIAVSIAR